MRAACRKFLDVPAPRTEDKESIHLDDFRPSADEIPDDITPYEKALLLDGWRPEGSLLYEVLRWERALGEFQTIFAIHVGQLAMRFGLELPEQFDPVLPAVAED